MTLLILQYFVLGALTTQIVFLHLLRSRDGGGEAPGQKNTATFRVAVSNDLPSFTLCRSKPCFAFFSILPDMPVYGASHIGNPHRENECREKEAKVDIRQVFQRGVYGHLI